MEKTPGYYYSTFGAGARTNAIMAAQEKRLTVRLRVMRLLRQRNDGRLFDLHARHAAFAERNAFITIVLMRRLRQETYGI